MHRSRILLLVGAVLGVASLFLDFLVTDLVGDVGGLDAEIVAGVALLVALGVIALIGDRREGLPAAGTVLVALASGGAVLFAVAKLIDAGRAAQAIGAVAGEARIGVGAWVLLAAAIIGLIGAVLTASRKVG